MFFFSNFSFLTIWAVGFAARFASFCGSPSTWNAENKLSSLWNRTRVSDPKFREDIKTIDVIPTKAYADYIAKNITDVGAAAEVIWALTYLGTQDSTHPPEYYNPVFDVEIDHGTVRIYLFNGSIYGGLIVNTRFL